MVLLSEAYLRRLEGFTFGQNIRHKLLRIRGSKGPRIQVKG